MCAMTQLRITDLLTNTQVDPEAHLDAARVVRYAEMLDFLPPIVVFDTAEGLLLADGYHRVPAARRRGLETIEAEVRRGSRHDALRYAATVELNSTVFLPKKLLGTSEADVPRVAVETHSSMSLREAALSAIW